MIHFLSLRGTCHCYPVLPSPMDSHYFFIWLPPIFWCYFSFSVKTAKEYRQHMQSNLKRLSKLTNSQLLIFSSLPDSAAELPFILPIKCCFLPSLWDSHSPQEDSSRKGNKASFPCSGCTQGSYDEQGSCVLHSSAQDSVGLMDFICMPWGITVIFRYTK